MDLKPNHKIVYTLDGHVEIVIPAPIDDLRRQPHLAEMTDEEYVALVFMQSIPEGATGIRVITSDQHPQDRIFRDAWTDEYDTNTIDVHLDNAKPIQLDRWREARKPLMEQLDVAFMKALEAGTATAEITAKKQALRDVTKTDLSHVTSAEELKNTWPDVLGKPSE